MTKFHDEVEAFLRDAGMPATRFGRLAMNDKSFVNHLRNGRHPRLDTAEKVREFMAAERLKLHKRKRRSVVSRGAGRPTGEVRA
jgi:hypothetical protein